MKNILEKGLKIVELVVLSVILASAAFAIFTLTLNYFTYFSLS